MFVLAFDAALLTLNTKAPFFVPLSQSPEAVKFRPKIYHLPERLASFS